MTQRIETVNSEGFRLSGLIWQLLKRQPRGYAEQVLDANPGLAALGPILPVGTVVKFPLDNIPSETPVTEAIRLWD